MATAGCCSQMDDAFPSSFPWFMSGVYARNCAAEAGFPSLPTESSSCHVGDWRERLPCLLPTTTTTFGDVPAFPYFLYCHLRFSVLALQYICNCKLLQIDGVLTVFGTLICVYPFLVFLKHLFLQFKKYNSSLGFCCGSFRLCCACKYERERDGLGAL